MLNPIKIDNHQVSIDNIYVTDDLAFLFILVCKEFSSPKWCFKCRLYRKVQLEHGHNIGEDQILNALRLVSESDSTDSVRLGVKEVQIWEIVEVDKCNCPILHNKINVSNNVSYNLFNYGNKYIKIISIKEKVARNYLSVIDASINKNIILRHDFDISTLIINAIDSINDKKN